MPTWKRKDPEGKTHFQFLCGACSSKKQALLETDQWALVRDGEPAACNDCVLQCGLTVQELWGAAEEVRFAVCAQCASYAACELKGRYFC